MLRCLWPALPIVLAAAPAMAAEPASTSPTAIVEAAPAGDWIAISADDLLVMDLAPGANGMARRVVIQLLPPPFSQGWVGNVRKLAAVHWWDGLSVYRVQDNYVAQWGDADGDDPAKARKLPAGLVTVPQREYSLANEWNCTNSSCGPEWGIAAQPGADHDSYADGIGFRDGFPVASNGGSARPQLQWPRGKLKLSLPKVNYTQVWPVHCYGMVGVARSLAPDTGTGAELYAVIGHAPRQLDRNIALVGRVIEGIEHLSSLPRGAGPLGFYETSAERVPIVSTRLGGEVAGLPRYEFLSTHSVSFTRYADARANRRDPFFIQPAGGADICNVPVPVRRAK